MRVILVGLSALALLACQPPTTIGNGANGKAPAGFGPGQLTVQATGEVTLPPDTAKVSAGVVTRAETAAEAMRDNAVQMAAAFEELEKAGIDPKNIQTSQISLQPQYLYRENRERRITGYEARNTVTAKTADLKAVGPMLDALVNAGINQINSVTFEIEDSKTARDEARVAAITAARARAEMMAKAAGVRLGKIVTLNEGSTSNFMPSNVVMARGQAFDSDSAVSPGEQSLKVSVTIVFGIKQ